MSMRRALAVLCLIAAAVSLAVFGTDLLAVDTCTLVPQEASVDQTYLQTNVMGRNLLLLDLEEVKAELEKDPSVKTAAISRRFPDSLVLTLEAREPAVLVEWLDGILIVGEDGCVMGFENERGDRELLVVEGLEFNRFRVNELLGTEAYDCLENLIVLSRFLKDAKLEAECARVEAGRLVLLISKDLRVEFGPADVPIGTKLEKFKWIYDDLKEKGINRGIIDMSFEKNPVYHPIQ